MFQRFRNRLKFSLERMILRGACSLRIVVLADEVSAQILQELRDRLAGHWRCWPATASSAA